MIKRTWCFPKVAWGRSGRALSLVALLVASLSWGASAGSGQQGVARTRPKYRVLYNQDCNNLFERGKLTPQSVERMVDEVVTGGADVMLVNVNTQRVNYPSKVWQTHWEGYKKGDRAFFGDVPDASVARKERWVSAMARLADQCDYLATALARCREKGIAPGISLRMNDMHDAPWRDSHMFSRFYKEHPQFQLKGWRGRSGGALGLDYAHAEVREHFLSLIRELAEDYDFDVLELDFLRFPYYFSREDIDRHCETMTGFIREVREILDGTGRAISLIPRVASSPGAARQLGFDVQAWAKEGIVDGITVGNMLSTCWDLSIERFRSLVGPEIAVYAAMEVAADRRSGLHVRWLPESYEMLRGFAAGSLVTGADGINVFNYFAARHHRPVTAEEFFGGLRETRSLDEARNKPRTHVLTAGNTSVECDMPEQVPTLLRGHKARRFEMLLAAEGEGQEAVVLVYFDGENEPEDLWLRIGLHRVGQALEIREGPEGPENRASSRKSKIAVFNLPASVIEDGRNELIIRSEKPESTILGIDVCIR